ncbi:NmrA family NAD(P)-binding protein [cf. Phormidesmis sp. LEGE 11477]|uniref:NmrA family NAD(P)-binding protein n=1 Tax=cf. Phormidesmis sp. LEGE 11477 TaxID=1828680 RepID=UPI00187E28D3|nr:NmrA family NAD(P)-binding protein [cf. Phormidesmis sp. LEGE 11477]MBE9059509.1 NmrA family NAD(P)-binding protein [cf. Phormidesmis sp. LEGE 11477]
MKIAISGATGQVGSKIVSQLIDEDSCELVLLSRRGVGLEEAERKGATVYTGDVKEPAFLREVLAGVDTFYLMFPPQNKVDDVIGHYQIILDNAIAAIKKHHIPRVVLQSSYGSHLSSGTGPVVGTYLAEKALRTLDIDFTAVRPSYFMENFLWFADSIRENGAVFLPISGEASTCFMATQDIAKAAAEVILDTQWHGNQIKELHGHCDLTFDQIAQIIEKELNFPVKHVDLSDEEAISAFVAPEVGFSRPYAKAFVEVHRAIENQWLRPEFPHSQETETMAFDRFVRDFLRPAIADTK